ncbi:MAG TPA: hypothetical protein VJ914_07785 [Pseudonocardiaceae bacterium]|nr:hypothetical protein [Pseudonocardiaceae bacterium]
MVVLTDTRPRRRQVRRFAPLAAAIGVIVAATIGLVLEQVNMPSHQHVPAISDTTVPTTH